MRDRDQETINMLQRTLSNLESEVQTLRSDSKEPPNKVYEELAEKENLI
jgi:DNA-binding HxlR family transcriptional regulator